MINKYTGDVYLSIRKQQAHAMKGLGYKKYYQYEELWDGEL